MKHTTQNLFITYTLLCTALHSSENNNARALKPHAIQYAPWREHYLSTVINTPTKSPTKDVFCSLFYPENPGDDSSNYILHRGKDSYVILNENPYTNSGHHLLIIPYHHEKHYTHVSQEARDELDALTQTLCEHFSDTSHEIHINFNIGKNALASIPEHLHQHVIISTVPRIYTLVDAVANATPPIDNETQYQQLIPFFTQLPIPYVFSSAVHDDDSCYYCSIIKQTHNDKKNFIIKRTEYATILFNHHPFGIGDIIIIPNKHYTDRKHMPKNVLTDMRSLLTTIYPLLLKQFNADDVNIGMISYGQKSTQTDHIRYQILPRPGISSVSPITMTNYIHQDIQKVYEQLVENMK